MPGSSTGAGLLCPGASSVPVTTNKPSAADPEFRHERARKAAAARHSIDTYITSIVDRAPELTAEQRDRLALLLRTGRAAAVLSDYPPAAHVSTDQRTSAHYQLAASTQYEPSPYGIAVAKDQTELRDVLRDALERVMRSGEYADVLQRWGVPSGALESATINAGGSAATAG